MAEFDAFGTAVIIAMVVAYILLTSWLTVRLRSRTVDQFMTASHSLPAAVIGVLLMSEFIGAKSTVGTAQEAFVSGIAASWSVLGASIGFLLFGLFFVKRLYGSGEYTISAAIAQKFGRSTMLTVSLIMSYALLLVNVGNYIGGAAAIVTVLKIKLGVAMCTIAAVSTVYYVFGGLKGVAWITLLHSAVKIVGIALILGVALHATGGVRPMMEGLPPKYFTWDGDIGPSTIVAWTVGTTGAIFSTQYIVQAIAGAHDAGAAQRSTFYAMALCFPLAIALGLIGVAARFLHPSMDSLYALPVFLQGMNPVLAGLVTTSLVASVFVSVSTVALAIASLIMRDFYVPYFHPEPAQELRVTRLISLAIAFVPLIFVFFVPEILRLSFFSRALRLSISIGCVWFGGTQEGIPDISVYFSRLSAGQDRWSEPVRLSDDPTRSEQNPILFPAPEGSLWLLWTAQISGNQDTAVVRRRISTDNGRNWGPTETLFDRVGASGVFVRHPPAVLDDGDILLPIFYCNARPGEKWVGSYDTSAVRISGDGGKTWQEYPVPDSTGCVHMDVSQLQDGSLLALFRSRWADNIYGSRSEDRGRTWSAPIPTALPNNNSSIQYTRLANGHLALIFNDINAEGITERRASLYDDIEDASDAELKEPVAQPGERQAVWGVPRAPMTLAISEDGGRTWPYKRNLEVGDGYCMTNNSREQLNREYSYPSIKQGPDGALHIAFTYFRQAIKYVRVAEAWVRG